MELKESRVLVTGATGFIGGRLAERLVEEEGAKVAALVRNVEKANRLASLGMEIVQGHVNDLGAIRRVMRGREIVFHCAALVHDPTAKQDEFHRVNVEGTRNVLEAAAEAGVIRFIHLSSIGVYGVSPKKGTQEKDPYQPSGDPYCDSKIEAERVALRFAEKKRLPVVIIRPANVYGPRSSFWTVALLEMIKAGKLQMIDAGSGMSNHVYIDNLIDAILLAAQNDIASGEAFIVSDGVNTSWKDFLGYYTRMLGREPLSSISKPKAWLIALFQEVAAQLTGKTPEISRRAVGFWTQNATYTTTKAQTKLGYRPRIALEEGMKRTEDWLRESGFLA